MKIYLFFIGLILGGSLATVGIYEWKQKEIQSLKHQINGTEDVNVPPQIGDEPVVDTADCDTGDSRTVTLSNPAFTFTVPCSYDVEQRTEKNRRGSFASYDFVPRSDYTLPGLSEIQFFTEKSIRDWNDSCGDGLCFDGHYSTLQDYRDEKKAWLDISDWKVQHMFVFNDRNFLVANHPCHGDICVIREYTTFIGDMQVDVWVLMNDLDEQEAADALFGELEFIQ